MASTGSATTTIETACPADSSRVGSPVAPPSIIRRCASAAARAVPTMRGRVSTSSTTTPSSTGTTVSTQTVTTTRAQVFRSRAAGSVAAPGHQRAQGGPDALEEVGHAGEVGEHVVAVEAHQREQLAQHLQDLGGDHQQHRVGAAGPPHAHRGHHHDGVEVEAAEVGAQAAGAAQAVGVGDVGVERRPDQVEAGAHHARVGPAAARGRRVPELVEAAGEHGDGQDRQQQSRAGEGLVGGRGQALDHQHPHGDGGEAEHDRHARGRGGRGARTAS